MNRFSVDVVNPLQALLLGQQAYSSGIENNKKQAMEAARSEAGQLYAQGDTKGALARLLTGGDLQAAGTYSGLDQQQYQRGRDTTLDARHDKEFAANQAYRNSQLALQRDNQDYTPEERAAQAVKYGLQPGTPEYAAFTLTGGLPAKTGSRSLVDDAREREGIAARLGLEKGSPAFNSFVATGKMGRDEGLTAGDRKVINEAEDDLPNIQGTLEALRTAKDLNSKTFSGITAGTRAFIGSNVPGAGLVIDKNAADATTEWQKIMGPEALKTMSSTLKGATTDFELRKFIEMLADPTVKPEIRGKIIDRMIKLGERQETLANRRINDLRGGTYYKPGNTPGAVAAPSGAAPAVVDWKTYFGGSGQ